MGFAIGRALAVMTMAAGSAHADPPPPTTLHVSQEVDLPVTLGALGLSVLPTAIPMRPHRPWQHELFDWDADVHDNFSPRAAHISDATVGLAVAAPVFYLASTDLTDAQADRLSIYGEALAIDLALVQIAKYTVQRPRPYTYNARPEAQAYTKATGDDAYQSFYSSHAAMSFGAAVAGATLFADGHADPKARAAVWGAGLTVASFTAAMRVRAGKHFYSDVIVGAIAGTAIGYVVPALHGAAQPSGADVATGLGGIVAGAILARAIPLGRAREVTDPDAPQRTWAIGPLVAPHGGGIALAFSH